MKKILLIAIVSLFSLKSFAGDGDKFFNLSGGWQWKNTVSVMAAMEFENKYHSAWEMYLNLSTTYAECPDHHRVDSKSFWDYKVFGLGAAYKPVITRGKNSTLRWRVGADLGANRGGFQANVNLGLEYNYAFRSGIQFFVLQRNDFIFWSRDHFRNGLFVGFKLPINN